MLKAKITQVGNSSGIVLGREILAKLHAERGDEVFLIETEDGYRIVSYNPEFEKQMLLAKKLLKKYRDVFHMLAKS
jgi:putative addiction module antidote